MMCNTKPGPREHTCTRASDERDSTACFALWEAVPLEPLRSKSCPVITQKSAESRSSPMASLLPHAASENTQNRIRLNPLLISLARQNRAWCRVWGGSDASCFWGSFEMSSLQLNKVDPSSEFVHYHIQIIHSHSEGCGMEHNPSTYSRNHGLISEMLQSEQPPVTAGLKIIRW